MIKLRHETLSTMYKGWPDTRMTCFVLHCFLERKAVANGSSKDYAYAIHGGFDICGEIPAESTSISDDEVFATEVYDFALWERRQIGYFSRSAVNPSRL